MENASNGRCAACGSDSLGPPVVVATPDDRAHDRAPHVYARCARCGQRSWRRDGEDRTSWRLWVGTFPLDSAFASVATRPAPSRRVRLPRWRPARRRLARA